VAQASGLSFTDRHPEVVLAAMAAWCGFFAWLYAAGLLSTRNVARHSWLAAAIGAAIGLALMAVIVVRSRERRAGWLFVAPLIVLFFGFITTARQLFPVLSGADGKVTTGFEAGVFALCAVLWCSLLIACLRSVPKALRDGATMRTSQARLVNADPADSHDPRDERGQ
jgi:cytochrome bd-type quinol oxidase subunit 2